MATYNIGLWISDGLQDYSNNTYGDPDRATKKLKSYLDAMNNRQEMSHTLSASVKGVVQTPVEQVFDSFTTPDPCNTSQNKTYDGLLDWWYDYSTCNMMDLEPEANLLVTDNRDPTGVAYGGGTHGTVNGGRDIADCTSSYHDRTSTGGVHDCVHAAIHEIGHNLMSNFGDGDFDGDDQHDVGEVYYVSGGDSITPMSRGGYASLIDNEGSGNECDQVYDTSNIQQIEFCYSTCCNTKFK